MDTFNRRGFLKAGAAGMGGAAALWQAAAAAQTPPPRASLRRILPMNRNWLYGGSAAPGCSAPDFDDSKFQRVTVPHSNKIFPWHSFDEKDFQFVSIYRRHFKMAPRPGHRVFVDFAGVMTAATVTINGHKLGEYRGGYTPFSFELTPHLKPDTPNVLAVEVDSTERPDIPPFGQNIDYLTFGGIYREVALRIVPPVFIENLFAKPADVLGDGRSVEVKCLLNGPAAGALTLKVELRDGARVLSAVEGPVSSQPLTLSGLGPIDLWDLDRPKLYTVAARLYQGGAAIDEYSTRIGFREARFTAQGFLLNGKHIKLRGLNRHQTFPYVGGAMPARVQRQDAKILRNVLHCNIVRTSHYPQSRHFLDACDELGLLVLEEIPGWQHIGDQAWKDIAVDNVGRMIRRDWNHPAIVLWGVRINESRDDHDFYTRTNALAHSLDPTRQTGGIRNFQGSEFLEDVFTMNDFGIPLKPPNHPRYLNTEFVGHTFPTKTTDDDERQREHTLRHARIHDQIASDPQYAGGIGWCAFDYNTHANFGSGDRICYHGVTDIFRELKPAGGFYKSQCEPAEEIVLEPAFHWARGDESVGFTKAAICSNCDHLKLYSRAGSLESNPWNLIAETDADREQFPHLKYPPFIFDLRRYRAGWGDLRIDGFIDGKQVISKSLSGRGVDAKFALLPDDHLLSADGADATRVVLRVTDEFGAIRTYADDPIAFALEGPADLIGDNPFALIGGTGAVWIRAREQSGIARLTAKHPRLGSQTITIELKAAPPESI